MFGACLLLKRILNAKQAEIEAKLENALRDWTEAQPDGKPSKLGLMLDATGAVVGSAAARSLMATMKQSAGADTHLANGVSDQLQAESNPLLGLLANTKRGKGAALMRLASLVGPLLNPSGPSQAEGKNGQGKGAQGRFPL